MNGPKNIKTKKDVIEYLRSSFAVGCKAIASLTAENAMEMIQYRWRKLPRLDLAFYALTHANEHYGQMALYLRMCGIIPPPTVNEIMVNAERISPYPFFSNKKHAILPPGPYKGIQCRKAHIPCTIGE